MSSSSSSSSVTSPLASLPPPARRANRGRLGVRWGMLRGRSVVRNQHFKSRCAVNYPPSPQLALPSLCVSGQNARRLRVTSTIPGLDSDGAVMQTVGRRQFGGGLHLIAFQTNAKTTLRNRQGDVRPSFMCQGRFSNSITLTLIQTFPHPLSADVTTTYVKVPHTEGRQPARL